jgi:oxygen-independent coproporphyrinogen-3 oxidase
MTHHAFAPEEKSGLRSLLNMVHMPLRREHPPHGGAPEEGGFTGLARITDSPAALAFDRKVAVHPGMGNGRPLVGEEAERVLDGLRRRERRDEVCAAYVHLPYCEKKCLYCGFFGGSYSDEAASAYLDALLREVESSAELPCVRRGAPVQTLYLGGGTPTAFRPADLSRLLRALRGALPLSNDCEITVEGRIHNFTPELIEACLEGGANRFSIGVQSFDTSVRRLIGRISAREEVIEKLLNLSAYRQAAIVVDLIFGLPSQTMESWEEDLRTFLSLPLDGVDLYQLNIFPGHSLDRAISGGEIPAPASLPEQAALYLRGVEIMRGARLRRLSGSHWGKTPRERNLYNTVSGKRADCLGYGACAGISLDGFLFMNVRSASAYMRAVEEGKSPLMAGFAPGPERAAARIIAEGMEAGSLDMERLDAALAENLPGAAGSAAEFFAPLLENWEQAGLIVRAGKWIDVTEAGRFWGVNLAQALISRCGNTD